MFLWYGTAFAWLWSVGPFLKSPTCTLLSLLHDLLSECNAGVELKYLLLFWTSCLILQHKCFSSHMNQIVLHLSFNVILEMSTIFTFQIHFPRTSHEWLLIYKEKFWGVQLVFTLWNPSLSMHLQSLRSPAWNVSSFAPNGKLWSEQRENNVSAGSKCIRSSLNCDFSPDTSPYSPIQICIRQSCTCIRLTAEWVVEPQNSIARGSLKLQNSARDKE